MTSMMTRMSSHMTQKMMGAVEQERALMVEQQTFDQPQQNPQKKSLMSTIMALKAFKSEEAKDAGLVSPHSTEAFSHFIKHKDDENRRK